MTADNTKHDNSQIAAIEIFYQPH